jgi:7,8-dihydropterin-6-yl-methyl-4-(beta-D-ribofuranosyl)aminobenzene 5'-phosphate synthase
MRFCNFTHVLPHWTFLKSNFSGKDGIIADSSIINLYDAFGKDTSLTKDFGFSCITKYKGKTILFDTGSNADIFKRNCAKLGIALKEVDMVVISHGYFDHLNGLDHLLQVNPGVKFIFRMIFFGGGSGAI